MRETIDLHGDLAAFIVGIHTSLPCPCWFKFFDNLDKGDPTKRSLPKATIYLMDEEGKKKYREMLSELTKMMKISSQRQTELSDEKFDFLLK